MTASSPIPVDTETPPARTAYGVPGNDPAARARRPAAIRASTGRVLFGCVVVLALAALVYLGYGLVMTWGRNYDGDLEERAREYALFRAGVYPHPKIEVPPAGFAKAWTVYPPYAFPIMAVRRSRRPPSWLHW